jgi:putative tryptophan/tyrosine transport system substrate-binding protein
MRRRGVVALLAGAILPRFAARAAGEPAKVLRLGVLQPTPPGPGYRAFVQQLLALGYEEGRNLRIDFVQLDSTNADRSFAMAAELVGRGVDVIRAGGTEVVLKSAAAVTRTVQIVMVATDYDPLARGYVRSLARPGGNVTGVFMQQIELTPKRLEFLTQAVPDLARVVVLWDRFSADQFEAAREAARSLKIPLDGIEFADPPYDYERALAGVEGGHRDVLLQMTSPLFIQDRQRFPAVALDHRLPSMFPFRQWVDAGGLMSYGASLTDMNRLAADYIDRIAKGAKPADLPVQQPTKFELVVNLKTAKTLGLTIPQSIIARADEVIEQGAEQ